MAPQLVLLLLMAAIAGLLSAETIVHDRALRRIPRRIHVNGTRGKSTVVRLIAAGLREGGLRVVAKTTGSAARLILEDGSDVPVVRPGRPTIGEQGRFLRWAASRGVDAVVVECMAVRPEYQRASEDYLVRAHIGVITNVRPDHAEVMGPDPAVTARAFAAAVPRSGLVITGESPYLPIIADGARRRRCRVITVTPDPTGGDLFPDNTALALEVCRQVGVDAETARRGMQQARPDPGALAVRTVPTAGLRVTCINAFAANDPVSARAILQRLTSTANRRPVIIYNHRADRPQRARAFVPVIVEQAPQLVLVAGDRPQQVARWIASRGVAVVPVTRQRPAEIMRAAAAAAGDGGTVVGLGNIAGVGLDLVRLWEASHD